MRAAHERTRLERIGRVMATGGLSLIFDRRLRRERDKREAFRDGYKLGWSDQIDGIDYRLRG